MAPGLPDERACGPVRAGEGWQCQLWRTQPGDWFCGQCGLPLPPVAIAFNPPVSPADAAEATGFSVQLTLQSGGQGDSKNLRDYIVEVAGVDLSDESCEFPLSRIAAGNATLSTDYRGGRFDLVARLRHRSRPRDAGRPVALGRFAYPNPTVTPRGGTRTLLPSLGEPLTIAVDIAPPDAPLELAHLEIGGVALTVSGDFAVDAGGARLTFTLEPEAYRTLALEQAARLRLRFLGVAEDHLVNLELAAPALLSLQVPEAIRALTGRRARIGCLIENGGGVAALVERVAWRASSQQTSMEGEMPDLAGLGIPGAMSRELRPHLVDANGRALPPGAYDLTLTIAYRDAGSEASSPREASETLRLEVRPDAPYDGRVCIDFGTTDTAAAVLPAGTGYFYQPETGNVPLPLELGTISPFNPDAARYFIPTVTAIGEDAQGSAVTLFGDAASGGAASLKHVRLIDRLKWRLGDECGRDGLSHDDVIALVAGYLEHVRELIEEHPAVAARVVKVIATRPAVFGDIRQAALLDAYELAGMEVDLERFGEMARPMVSESWPPVLLMLPLPEGLGEPSRRLREPLKMLQQAVTLPELFDLATLQEAPAYICVFDIGGGSTDVSLLRLSTDGGPIRVSDVWTNTDDQFAGEAIRDLIVEQLERTLRTVRPDYGPLPDRQGLRSAAADLQYYPHGPFECIDFYDFADDFAALAPETVKALDKALAEDQALLQGIPIPGAADAQELLVELKKKLTEAVTPQYQRVSISLSGAEPLPLAGDALHELMARVIIRFGISFLPRFRSLFGHLVGRLAGAALSDVRMLMTGRGSGFALIEPLIRFAAAECGASSIQIHRSLGSSAKAVTSWGALALYASRKAGGFLEFAGLAGEGGYALRARDPIRGVELDPLRLEPVEHEGRRCFGLALASIPPGYDRLVLTVGESLDAGQQAQDYARFGDNGLHVAAERIKHPDGAVLFDPHTLRIFVSAEPMR